MEVLVAARVSTKPRLALAAPAAAVRAAVGVSLAEQVLLVGHPPAARAAAGLETLTMEAMARAEPQAVRVALRLAAKAAMAATVRMMETMGQLMAAAAAGQATMRAPMT
jgi:hypothetical protein